MTNYSNILSKFNIDFIGILFITFIMIGFFYNYSYYNIGFGFNIFNYLTANDIAISWISNENILIILIMILSFKVIEKTTDYKAAIFFISFTSFLIFILVQNLILQDFVLGLIITMIFIYLQYFMFNAYKNFDLKIMNVNRFNQILNDFRNLNFNEIYKYIDEYNEDKINRILLEINHSYSALRNEQKLVEIYNTLNIILEIIIENKIILEQQNNDNDNLRLLRSLINDINLIKNKIDVYKKMIFKSNFLLLIPFIMIIPTIFGVINSNINKASTHAKFVEIELANGNEKEINETNLLLIGITSDYTILSSITKNYPSELITPYSIFNLPKNDIYKNFFIFRNSDISYIKFVEEKKEIIKSNNIKKLDTKKVYFTDASFIFNPELEKNNTTINEIIDEIKFNHYNYHYVINIIGNANSKEINKSNTSIKDNYLLAEARAHNIKEYLMDNLLTKNINLKNISINSFSNSNQLSESTQENINKQRNCEIKIFKYKI